MPELARRAGKRKARLSTRFAPWSVPLTARRLRSDPELDTHAPPVAPDLIGDAETLRRRVRLLERVNED